MRQFIELVDRFRRDERGVFGIIFALLAIVLVAMAGAVVDFTSVQQARTKAQVALDSAALALQPTIYGTGSIPTIETTIQGQAQTLVQNRLLDGDAKWTWPKCSGGGAVPCMTVNSSVIDPTAGTLTLTATMTLPMNFVSLIGIPTMQVQILSVATRQKLNLEVAMVLDNSGSMDTSFGTGTRMTSLHTAAYCAVDILFYNDSSCSTSPTGTLTPNVKIGIVPFTEAVNAGHSLPTSALDLTGTTAGSVTVDNLDYTGTIPGDYLTNPGDKGVGVNRVTLFSGMQDSSRNTMSWQGCLQARATPYDTDATAPTASSPATLYTPYFAVDEPDGSSGGAFYNNYISDTTPTNNANACKISSSCTIKAVATTTTKNGKSSTTTTTTDSLVAADGETSSSCSCSGLTTTTTTKTSGSTTTTTQQCGPLFAPANLTQQQLQMRVCKYNGARMTSATAPANVFGPNGDCPAAAVQPLNATPSTILSAITAMQPVGGTNITEGAAWGFRLLSPNDPYDAQPFGAATSKTLIIMTDGANTIYPGTNMNDDEYNSAYGFPLNTTLNANGSTTQIGRLLPASAGKTQLQSAASLQAEMDNRLSTVCTNAKNAGVTVYVIGVDVADSEPTSQASAQNQTNLTNCASPGDAYFTNDQPTLISDFKKIAQQLAALRLAK